MTSNSLISNLKRCLRSDPEYIPDFEYDFNDFYKKKIRLENSEHVRYHFQSFGEYLPVFELDDEGIQSVKDISHENLSEVFLTKFRWPLGKVLEDDPSESANYNDSIFNIPLVSIPDELKHPKNQTPRVIVRLMKLLLQKECLQTIGAFRIDALTSKTVQHRHFISSGLEGDGFLLEEITNFGKMSLLKQFFRGIPGSLISRSITGLMYQVCSNYDDVNILSKVVRWILTYIPLAHYKALAFLCLLLNQYSKYEESNLMSAGSLAVCWSPILFDMEADVLVFKSMTNLLTLFITKWDKFFMLSL